MSEIGYMPDWKVVGSEDGMLLIRARGENSRNVAFVQYEEDANLISASPDMFEVLKAVEWVLGTNGKLWCPHCLSCKAEGHKPDCQLSKAIAKANNK